MAKPSVTFMEASGNGANADMAALIKSLQWIGEEQDGISSMIESGSCSEKGVVYRNASIARLSSLRVAASNLMRSLNELSADDEEGDEDHGIGEDRRSLIHQSPSTPVRSTLSRVPEESSGQPSNAPAPLNRIPRSDTVFSDDEKRMDTVLMEGYLYKLPMSAAGKDISKVGDKLWKERYFKLTALKLEWHGSDDAWTSLGSIVRSALSHEEKKGELRLRTHFQVRESTFWENALSVEVDQQCLFIRCESYDEKDKWYRALQEAQVIRRAERTKTMSLNSGVIESAAAVEHLAWRPQDIVDWTGLLEDMAHPASAADKIQVACSKRLQNHTDAVYNCAWSHDGTMVLTAAKESRLLLWDSNPSTPKSKERVAEVNLTGTFTLTCAISPSTRLIAAGGLQENVLVGSWNKTDVQGKKYPLSTVGQHEGYVSSMCFLGSDHSLASGSGDSNVIVWDVGAKEKRCSFTRSADVLCVAAHPTDNNLLLAGGADLEVRVHDVRLPGSVAMFDGSESDIEHIAVNGAVPHYFVSSSRDGVARIYDMRRSGSEPLVSTPGENIYGINQAVFSNDGRWLYAALQKRAWSIFDGYTGRLVKEVSGHSDVVTSISVSPKSGAVCTGSKDSSVCLWNVSSPSYHTKNSVRPAKG